MVYSTACSKCDHRHICKIRTKFTECIDANVDIIGADDVFNKCEIIFACPYSTSLQHQEALLAYKKALQ